MRRNGTTSVCCHLKQVLCFLHFFHFLVFVVFFALHARYDGMQRHIHRHMCQTTYKWKWMIVIKQNRVQHNLLVLENILLCYLFHKFISLSFFLFIYSLLLFIIVVCALLHVNFRCSFIWMLIPHYIFVHSFFYMVLLFRIVIFVAIKVSKF